MTDTLTPVDDASPHSMPLQGAQLPRYAPALAAGIAVGIAVLAVLLAGVGLVAAALIAWILLAVGLPAWSRAVCIPAPSRGGASWCSPAWREISRSSWPRLKH